MWSLAFGGDVGDQLVGAFQNPGLLLGIPLALAGAVFMSFGAQYQHRGVTKVERLSGQAAAKGLTGGQMFRLLSRPSWVVGGYLVAPVSPAAQLPVLGQLREHGGDVPEAAPAALPGKEPHR